MSDTIHDICAAPRVAIRERHEIPYDVDFLWNDGCRGSDLWPDDAGTSVRLLVSDSGSAYACPAGQEGFWRIYVDPAGRAFELGLWPGAKNGDYELSMAGDEFAEVVACAVSSEPDRAGELSRFTAEPVSRPSIKIHSMPDGLTAKLSAEIFGSTGWEIVFEPEMITLRNDDGRRGFVADSLPLVSNTCEVCLESEHNHVEVYGVPPVMECEEAYYPMLTGKDDLVEIVSIFLAESDKGHELNNSAFELASRVFDRACRTLLEIEALEAECYGQRAAPAAPPAAIMERRSGPDSPSKVLIIGDSIAASYGYLYPGIIGSSLRPELALVDAIARDGYSIERALDMEDRAGGIEPDLPSALEEGYDELVLAIGVNSVAAGWKTDSLRGRLRDACRIAVERGVKRIVLVEIAPWGGSRNWTEQKQEETIRYNEMLSELADEINFESTSRGRDSVVDVARIYDSLEDEANPGYLKYPRNLNGRIDRLHPDERGLMVIAGEIVDQIYPNWTTQEYRHEKERLMFRSQ